MKVGLTSVFDVNHSPAVLLEVGTSTRCLTAAEAHELAELLHWAADRLTKFNESQKVKTK